MHITPLPLNGLFLVEARVFRDSRGSFFESFNETDFDTALLPTRFAQDNVSSSGRGTVRGLHFQKPPHAQGKLVRVFHGTVLDVAIDLRKGSPTYGKWHAEELSSENARSLYIPPGFAHGFCVTSESAVFFYKCTTAYSPAAESGILWNDPTLNIDWPVKPGQALVSDKDSRWPPFGDNDSPFVFEVPAK
ncbi:MAG: dTDP-4-dehydrorhamnose 3,5-epimerase [Elusimicrobia bacterium]|jgi:dTDP-4-dehydrorhamnose 3,5-epimerase|nr:dTDP-4-dehydrorhamnose 3,5-epimerase [Elusimicrobiota bacterium]